MVFEVKFEGRVGCYDSKQGEALGAVRTGKRASVFGNGNTRGRKCTEIRVGRHAGAGVYRALRNDWEVWVIESYDLICILKRSLCEKYFGRKPKCGSSVT